MSFTEAVKVESPHFDGGFVIINKDDFDPEKHVLFDEKKLEPKAELEPKAVPKPAASAGK